ncbi:hypothetical protein SS50377_27894 [Spironucleus salmonicida]|uniref:Uncharacterized protein n=1 Tax=Spironucleus salmonicida TaxID=348837 RepID=V6LX27_9EUKA|nr:hypothetical protein SS50377_27894 [Spironucleus salmonicida]|eukprot:EST48793.1 Hypothetical protein SS50377_10884 [Spironucleus salmonicida]
MEETSDSYYAEITIEESSKSESYSAEPDTSIYASESISLQEDPEFLQKIEEIKKMQKETIKEEHASVPFPIIEPKLYDEKLTSIKNIPASKPVDQQNCSELHLSTSSPENSINPDELTLEQQTEYYKKLAASQLRQKKEKVSTKLHRGERIRMKKQQQKLSAEKEFEDVKGQIYQEEIPELAKIYNMKPEQIQEMLEQALEFEAVSSLNEDLCQEIEKLQKRLARANPINEKFIEDIGRIQFKYKDQEKRDYGLSTEDLMSLPDKTFQWLCLDLAEFDGLGDVDIGFYKELQKAGAIIGTRKYTDEEARKQSLKLDDIREDVIAKYPKLYQQKRNFQSGENMNSNKNQLKQIKGRSLEMKLKKKEKNERQKAKKIGK